MATPIKIGTEFLVDTNTANNQSAPSIAALANGQFLVAFQDYLPPPGGLGFSTYGIRGQLFNASGATSGNAFDIFNIGGAFAVAGAGDANVLGLEGGSFSATYQWSSEGLATLNPGIGQEFFSGKNVTTTNSITPAGAFATADHARQTQLTNGDVVTVYSGGAAGGIASTWINIQTGTGTISKQVSIESGNQVAPSIAALTNGGFVTVWEDDTNAQATVWFQRFDSSGNAVGSNTAIPSQLAGAHTKPVVAGLTNGQFVAVFEDTSGAYVGDVAGKALVARVFDANGSAAGDFLVDTTATGDQSSPSIVALADGRFFVVWVDASSAGTTGTEIRGQLFKSDGSGSFVKDGSEVLVDTNTAGDQIAPSLTTTIDGRIIVSWQTSSGVLDADGTGISAQIIDPREHGMTFNATLAATQLVGTAYNDVVYANGDTVFIGGSGFDVAIEKNPGVTINVGVGTTLFQVEEVVLASGTNAVNGSSSGDFLYFYGGGASSTNTMTLGSGGGYEISVGGVNHMFGGAAGTDVFIGGIGTSDMHGGAGTNVYYTGAADTVFGAGTYNTDVLLTPSVTLTNGVNLTNVQQVILNGGTNTVDMTGSNDFVVLYAGAGTNTLKLGAGGGYEFATGGTNHMLGNAGGSGTDVFISGIGTSDMHGGGGNNVYFVGANDSVVGGGTYNTLTALAPGLQLTPAVASNVQTYLLNGGHNFVDASSSTKQVIVTEQSGSWSIPWGTASDTFIGGSGNDVLLAYGHDQNILNGGPGDDVLIGWGHNTFIFQPGSGHDVIENLLWNATNQYAFTIPHGAHSYDLTAFAAVGIHSIADLTFTNTQDANGNVQLLVQMGSDSFRLYTDVALTSADFVFA